jgi:16S rRNA (cytosine1402-N4)-methyltransferase
MIMMEKEAHQPVLLNEVVENLLTDLDGFYIDGTFGRGGHTRAILEKLSSKGNLLAYDKDNDAFQAGLKITKQEARFNILHKGFENIYSSDFNNKKLKKPKGILLDLGLSSPQLDTASRGFSFMRNGQLDMRYDQNCDFSAYELINDYPEEKLFSIIREYGEEVNARLIARKIVIERNKKKITSTSQLAALIQQTIRKKNNIHPATKTFQAIRIAVNDELSCIRIFLDKAIDLIDIGGRLAIISFHSLEDRIVKKFVYKHSTVPRVFLKLEKIPKEVEPKLRSVVKLIKPTSSEVLKNPRSRSARLRIVERIR